MDTPRRIGFVATRISETDGVSLETKKWATILQEMGAECFFIAGESDLDGGHTYKIEEAHFLHPAIRGITRRSFGVEYRDRRLTDDVNEMAQRLRRMLHAAMDHFQLDLLIAENSLTIPMNIPLGLALVQVVQESGIPCIAHHHDFCWERERFLVNAVEDFLRAAFPPPLAQIDHVVINSLAGQQFGWRTGQAYRIIPNVMDFDNPPPSPDDYARGFRQTIGVADDDLLFLQPTRVVARKGIEHAMELVKRMGDPRVKLVVSHASGDEGDAYSRRIRKLADWMDVNVIFADRWISDTRGKTPYGEPRFTISDAYQQADLVTYPSSYEGFGNAFLEAVYFKLPVLCNRYGIFRADIEPSGFRPILMEGFLTDAVVDHVRQVQEDSAYRKEMVEHNYHIGQRFFSYEVVRRELESIFAGPRHPYRGGHSP